MARTERPIEGLKMSQVEKLTGIGAHTLRAWERRYGVPRPGRSDGRQRLYSLADVDLINRMRQFAQDGVALNHAARMALREIEERDQEPSSVLTSAPERLMRALLEFDERDAASAWSELIESGDLATVFDRQIVPMLVQVGEGWHDGDISVGQEHFASAFVRTRLETLQRQVTPGSEAPTVVLACMAEERHELALMMLTVLLRFNGLRTIYLGQDVPDDALLRTVEDVQPQVLALNAVSVESAERMPQLVRGVRELAPLTQVFFGGNIFDTNPEFREVPEARYAGHSLRGAAELISRAARERRNGGAG